MNGAVEVFNPGSADVPAQDPSLESGDVFGSIVEIYRREGFDAGYRRALHDLLAGLVLNCEEFLRERDAAVSRELRPVLYGFVDRLEREIVRSSEHHGYVEGGLGI